MPATTPSTTRIAIGIAAVIALLVGVFVVIALVQQREAASTITTDDETGLPELVLDESHRLDEVDEPAVTVVEFLDFECESCGALYPYVEEAREKYRGEITYVVRYFPLPGHVNSMNAALAAEAASRQGAFEPMYHRLFETQGEWGENSVSTPEVFRAFAEQLGLDMARFDADMADPAVAERVAVDFNAGRAFGVAQTPTFFINGDYLQLTTVDSLDQAIAEALVADEG